MKKITKLVALFLTALTFFSFVFIIEASAPVSPVIMTAEAKSKVKLNRNELLLAKYEDYKLKVKGTKKKVKWSSSNKKVATVKNGRVTAKKKGTAIITAKVGKKKYKCKVTVFNRIYEGGMWKCDINGVTYYFTVNDYTSQYGPYKAYGVVYVSIDIKEYNEETYGEYKRIGINEYRYKCKGSVIDFKVYKDKIIVKQVSGKIHNADISGTYTLVHRPYGG